MTCLSCYTYGIDSLLIEKPVEGSTDSTQQLKLSSVKSLDLLVSGQNIECFYCTLCAGYNLCTNLQKEG